MGGTVASVAVVLIATLWVTMAWWVRKSQSGVDFFRSAKRRRDDVCAKSGYDMRATPRRRPERGTARE